MSNDRPLRVILTTIVIVASLICTGCHRDNRRQCEVATHAAGLTVLDWKPTYEVVVACPTGEQLLGGGFTLGDPLDLRDDAGWTYEQWVQWNKDHPSGPMVIIASYPSSENEWTVIAANPDPQPSPGQGYSGNNLGVLITAYCYCATGDTDLGMGTASIEGPPSIDVEAPDGAVVTGGGFKEEATGYLGFANAGNIQASEPLSNSLGQAIGWHVIKTSNALLHIPPVTSYVRYAMKGLQPSTVKTEDIEPGNPLGGKFIWQVKCHNDEFVSGGGYEFTGDLLAGHWMFESRGRPDLDGWQTTTTYFGATVGQAKMSALCIKLPQSVLQVSITEPHDGECVNADDGVSMSWPVRFKALATLGCNEVSAELKWRLFTWDTSHNSGSGSQLGRLVKSDWSGNNTSRTLQLYSIPRIQRYHVYVTARYNGQEASDDIMLDAGCTTIK